MVKEMVIRYFNFRIGRGSARQFSTASNALASFTVDLSSTTVLRKLNIRCAQYLVIPQIAVNQ